MATIREMRSRGGVRYQVQVRLRGYPPQVATFDRKTDARDWAQETESAIRQGRHLRPVEAKRHTVAEMIDRYCAEVLEPRHGGDVRKRSAQLVWWKAKMGPYTLAQVTPAMIAELRERLRRGAGLSGKPASPATQVRYLASLSHVFSVAVREWEWLDTSPCSRVRRPAEPRGRVRYLDDDERRSLLAACQRSADPRLYLLVVLALSTGARQGELMGLRWRDIDLNAGAAVLHHTKNGERRRLPFAGLALELLRQHGRVRRFDRDHLFLGRDDSIRFPRQAWIQACRDAELVDFRFHDLRHSAASYLAMNGATLAEIAEILGHRTLQMVKRYSHLSPQHTGAVVARMNEAIFGKR